jgi:hypothetical protein
MGQLTTRVELWTALVQVRALEGSELEIDDGAFVNVVAPARDPPTFELAARQALAASALEYVLAESLEPFERRLADGRYAAELVELAIDAAATGGPQVGTLHVYPADAPDADVEWTSEKRLREAEQEAEIVDVTRVDGFDSLCGYVVEIDSELFVVENVSDDVTLDGYSVVRLGDVSEVGARRDEHFAGRALTLLGLRPTKPDLDLRDFERVLRSLRDRDELVTIALEKVAPDVVYIGKIERVESSGVFVRLIDPEAGWREAEFYEFREITCVSFGGRYAAALLLVARDREEQEG